MSNIYTSPYDKSKWFVCPHCGIITKPNKTHTLKECNLRKETRDKQELEAESRWLGNTGSTKE